MKLELHSMTQAFAFALIRHSCTPGSLFPSLLALLWRLTQLHPSDCYCYSLQSHIRTPDRPFVPNVCSVACSSAANDFNWRLVNGLWGLILAVGLVWTSLTVRQARSWLYFKGWERSFLADYGVPLVVVIWSAVGYCVNRGTPTGIPRRTRIPNTWDEKTNWTVARVCTQLMG